jgi:hypothetical protein
MKTTHKNPLLTLTCLVATATALPAAITSTAVFVDDFSTDSSADYTLTSTFGTPTATFDVDGGTLNLPATGGAGETADVFYNTAIFEVGQTVSVEVTGLNDTYLTVSTTTFGPNVGSNDGVRLNWMTDGKFRARRYTNGSGTTTNFNAAFDVAEPGPLTLYLYRVADNTFAAAYDNGSGFTWLNTTGGAERQDFTAGDTGNGALYIGVETFGGGERNFDNLTLSVPEPSSTALLGLGGLALMLRRKRS